MNAPAQIEFELGINGNEYLTDKTENREEIRRFCAHHES